MPRKAKPGGERLSERLRGEKISRRTVRQIGNLYAFYDCPGFEIAGRAEAGAAAFRVVLPQTDAATLERWFDDQNFRSGAIVVIAPDRGRKGICRRIAEKYDHLSIDKRNYFIYFYGRNTPKQHFRL